MDDHDRIELLLAMQLLERPGDAGAVMSRAAAVYADMIRAQRPDLSAEQVNEHCARFVVAVLRRADALRTSDAGNA